MSWVRFNDEFFLRGVRRGQVSVLLDDRVFGAKDQAAEPLNLVLDQRRDGGWRVAVVVGVRELDPGSGRDDDGHVGASADSVGHTGQKDGPTQGETASEDLVHGRHEGGVLGSPKMLTVVVLDNEFCGRRVEGVCLHCVLRHLVNDLAECASCHDDSSSVGGGGATGGDPAPSGSGVTQPTEEDPTGEPGTGTEGVA